MLVQTTPNTASKTVALTKEIWLLTGLYWSIRKLCKTDFDSTHTRLINDKLHHTCIWVMGVCTCKHLCLCVQTFVFKFVFGQTFVCVRARVCVYVWQAAGSLTVQPQSGEGGTDSVSKNPRI